MHRTAPLLTLAAVTLLTAACFRIDVQRPPIEVEDPGPGDLEDPTPAPPPDADFMPTTNGEALARFGACLTLADWNATYGVDAAHETARQNTSEGTCLACHSTGVAGAFLSSDATDTFGMMRRRPSVLKLVAPTGADTSSGAPFVDLAPSYRLRDKGGEGGDHPAYLLTETRTAAVDDLVERALARFYDFTRDCDDE